MELLTKKILSKFEQLGSQEGVPFEDKIVVAKFFNPVGRGYWYATEYNPDTGLFFGYVSLFGDWNDEWGYFSLEELERFRGIFGLGIERDKFWTPKRFGDIDDPASGY